MNVRAHQVTLVNPAAGAGTAISDVPLCGEIVEIRLPAGGSVIADSGGTADFTLTRVEDGGTVLAVSNVTAPFQYQPRRAVHFDAGGTTAYGTGVGPVVDAGGGIPIDGYLSVAWAQGSAAVGTATMFVYVRDGRW